MSAFIDGLFSEFLPGLQKKLQLTYRRNEAIVSNISNAETPGYRAVEYHFANELEKAFNHQQNSLKMTNPKHMDLSTNSQAHLIADFSGATKPDGNNVDIDIQMGRLAYNSGKYSVAAQLVRHKMRNLKETIRLSVR